MDQEVCRRRFANAFFFCGVPFSRTIFLISGINKTEYLAVKGFFSCESYFVYSTMVFNLELTQPFFLKRKRDPNMTSDIAIAQSAKMLRISQVAQRYDIEEEYLEPYGHYKAKISLDFLDTLRTNPTAS